MADEDKSFWVTLPGILTAIGAIIVAIATLTNAIAPILNNTPSNPPGDTTPPTFMPAVQTTTFPSYTPTTTFPTYTMTPETPLSFKVIPFSAKPGEDVTLILSKPESPVWVYLNDAPLPKTQVDEGVLRVTIPARATSGYFKIVSEDGETAKQYFVVITPTPTVTTSSVIHRAPPAP